MNFQKNKKAIIVGASSGIGKEIALCLTKQGWTVAVLGRRKSLLDELCQNNKNLMPFEIDVDNVESLQNKLQSIADGLGGLDLFVISSGVGFINPELDFSKEQQTIKTNVEGFTALLDWSYKFFKSRGCGQIAAITSSSGLMTGDDGPAYSASKAYQINYLKTIAKLAKKECPNVSVTELRPGSVDTAMMKGEGHFWISKPEYAAQLACKAILKKKKLQYISKKWRIIGTMLRLFSIFE
jgi:short-subunit dehydrogenase